MSQPVQPQGAFTGKVRKQMLPIDLDQALAAASAAGYRQTPRSRTNAAHIQRKWNEAATIQPVPGGVVVRPAWTTAQIVAVVAVLAAFLLLAVCPNGAAIFAA